MLVFFGGVIDSSLDLFVAVESLLLFIIVTEDAAVNIKKEKETCMQLIALPEDLITLRVNSKMAM